MPEEAEPLGQEKEDIFLKYLSHLNYYLKYRNVDKQSMETMLLSQPELCLKANSINTGQEPDL